MVGLRVYGSAVPVVDGHSLRAIAGALGVSHPTVIADLRAGGKSLPPQIVLGADGKRYPARRSEPAKRQQDIAEAVRLRADGWTLRAIAEELGVGKSTVEDWLSGTGSSADARQAAAEEAKRQQDIVEAVRLRAQGIDPGGDR